MKKFIISTLIVLLAVFSVSAESKVAAKVNGQNIYQSEVRYIINQFLLKNGIDPKDVGYDNPQLQNYKNDILERLIERELLYSVAVKNIDPNIDKRVEEILAKIEKQYKSQGEFEKALATSGTTVEELKSKLRKNTAIDDYMIAKTKDMPVTDKEIETFYNENRKAFIREEKVKASHILIEIKGAVDADMAKERIDKIYQELQYNTNFEEMAKKYSTGPSGKKGGDLGYFRRHNDMVEAFAAVAFDMKVGDISKPVKSEFGYHIIKVYDHQEALDPSLADVRGKIKTLLSERKVKEFLENQIKEIREKSKIEKFV